jgi:hypothetical protein
MSRRAPVLDSCVRRTARLIFERSPGAEFVGFGDACVFDPFLPAGDIVVLCLVKTVAQAGDGISGRFIRVFAKTKRQDKFPCDLERSIPAVRATLPFSARVYSQVIWFVRLQILPAVRRTDVAGRPLGPRRGTRQRQRAIVPLRKQQRRPLKFAHPGGIAAAVISQMRREQDVQVIIRQRLAARETEPVATPCPDADRSQSAFRCGSGHRGRC